MRVLTPRNTQEAVSMQSREPQALVLAGGTDLMVSWNMGVLNGKTVLDLSGVGEWKNIRVANNGVLIGALITHSEIQRHSVIRKKFPLLVQACATVGAVQIQNRGTLAGNIANASPAGDTFPSLAIYEAVVHAVSTQGRRAIPFPEVFAGVKKTNLRPGELIEAVEIPFLKKSPSRQVFRKVGTRRAQAISKTVMAGILWLDLAEKITDCRIAFGSVAPTVRRLSQIEALALGRQPGIELGREAAARLKDEISPIDDVRSTALYRLRVSENLVRAFLDGSSGF